MTQAGSMPREIASAIRLADPTVRILAQDIYNERRKQGVERIAGKSPIEAMVIWLENSEWFAEVKQDIDGRLHISFLHIQSLLHFLSDIQRSYLWTVLTKLTASDYLYSILLGVLV
jgi:hypothetical protein